MANQFVIIDDSSNHIANLKDYLEEAFKDGSAVVFDAECTTWNAADDAVKSFPDASDYVAFFDLSLQGSEVADAGVGIERVRALRAQRREWTMIAYSRFGELIDLPVNGDECFDGIVSKQRLHGMKRHERIAYVKSNVVKAVAHHHHRELPVPDDAVFVDSFGMRVFRATFGDNAVAELLAQEAAQWVAPRVAALTSGHSGAHLIEISNANSSVVLKLARAASVIEHEIQAVGKNLTRLHAFVGKIAHLDTEMKTLSGGAVYYRQANVRGDSLLNVVTSCTAREALSVVEKVAEFSVETTKAYSSLNAVGRAPFSFTPVDRGRFETSVLFLVPLAKTMIKHGLLKISDAALEAMRKRVLALVDGWDSNSVVTKPTFLVLQHGDFNPGNVLVTRGGDLILIDLARFGDWPAGYDLARLALMLRLRLIDRAAQEDWLPFKLQEWFAEHVARVSPDDRDAAAAKCRIALRCDAIFRRFVEGCPEDDRSTLRHGYQLGSMWDLIKVVSYQDVSQYKRLWALFELDRLAQNLGAYAAMPPRLLSKRRSNKKSAADPRLGAGRGVAAT